MKKLLCLALTALMLFGSILPAAAEETPMVLPVVSTLLDASITDMQAAEDYSSVYYAYAPVTEDHLYYYLTLATMVGTYAMEAEIEDSSDLWYVLVSPGAAVMAVVVYSPENQTLQIETNGSFIPMQDEDAQSIYDYLAQGFVYPEGTSGYILPEFWAVAGKSPVSQNTISEADHIFDGKTTYFETYADIDFDVINQYTQYMLRYGFDASLDNYFTDNGYVDPVYIHFTNGEMEVILYYSITDQVAQVFTKPGVLPYLLNQAQIRESFGQ